MSEKYRLKDGDKITLFSHRNDKWSAQVFPKDGEGTILLPFVDFDQKSLPEILDNLKAYFVF